MYEQFLNVVAAAMVRKGISRAELARRLQADRSQVSNWFNKHDSMTTDSMDRICKALGIRVEMRVA